MSVYGPDVTSRAVLDGGVPAPAQAHTFLSSIRSAITVNSKHRNSKTVKLEIEHPKAWLHGVVA
jgi:hypothetical protein